MKRSAQGTLHLKISESRFEDGAHFEHSRIVVFAEDGHLDEFGAAVNECAAFVRGAQNHGEAASADRMAQSRANFPNAYAP